MKTIIALLPLISLVLAVVATVRCVRAGQRDVALILWLLFIWLMPILGPCVALYAIPRTPSMT